MVKRIYAFVGFVCLLFGSIGTVVPILPSVPFFLISTVCFARSSTRLNAWFKESKFYQDNLDDLVTRKAMTLKVKVKVMISVTLLMALGFVVMGVKGIIPGCIVLVCVWLFHVLYFTFVIKTLPSRSS